MKQGKNREKLNNKGSAMILVVTVLSFIAILGVISITVSLLNIRMRGLNRRSDKNFYYLETALEEIYAQTGRLSSELLKEAYADIISNLYQPGYEDNEEANQKLKEDFIDALTGELEISGLSGENITDEEECQALADRLKQFSDTVQKENLDVSVGSVRFHRDMDAPLNVYGGLVIEQLCLTYTEPETDTESALTVDLNIQVPYVRFINKGSALLDYIMAANGGIEINPYGGSDSEGGKLQESFTGNIYGSSFSVNKAEVTADSALFTAAGMITLKKQSSLKMGGMGEDEQKNKVWANGIELNFSSELVSENTSFYIQDDMTFKNGGNKAELSGSYYGYGNEGQGTEKKGTPDKSSAILLNDKNSSLDFSNLESLILAGRAYLRFNTESDNNSQYVYPMGESIAVRASQVIYLIPEGQILVDAGAGGKPAGSNPVAFPMEEGGPDYIWLHITVPSGGEMKTVSYQITKEQALGNTGKASALNGLNETDEENPVFLVALNGKIYIYYNFSTEEERSEYFETYLEEQGDTFEALLQKGGITGVEGEGQILLNEEGNIASSGSLYQVAGEGENGYSFELLQTRSGGISSSLTWVELSRQLKQSFDNIKTNLAETVKVKGRVAEEETGGRILLPVGNYIRLDKLKKLTKPIHRMDGVLLFGGDVTLHLNGDSASVSCGSSGSYDMSSGLIASYGTIKVTGNGSFNGLLLSGNKILIEGDAELTADPEAYVSFLEETEIAEYFYDYSDAASTVLNDYKDFVKRENWIRAGREPGGNKDEEE